MPDRQPDLVMPLYDKVPAQQGTGKEDNPWLEVFRAPNPTGATVLVLPGGGYGGRAAHEAAPIALWLNTIGIHGVVVHYRVSPYRHPQPLNDAAHAMRLARSNAKAWGVDPKRVAVLGSSAGGHLASTLSTHYDVGAGPEAADFEHLSSRPDLSILLYPVITFSNKSAHIGSRKNLLGDAEDPKLVELLSNEKRVTKETPPAFVFHTVDDAVVDVENVYLYTQALRAAGVPFEMHLYETGRHGVGLAQDNPALKTWPDLCANWLRARGWAR